MWEAALHKICWFAFTWSQDAFTFNLVQADVVDQTHCLLGSFTDSKEPLVWVDSQRGYTLTALDTFKMLALKFNDLPRMYLCIFVSIS